jgi:predicted peroxiredoxin
MPRYFFNVRSPSGLEMDPQGLDFPNLAEAIADARKAGAEMLLDRAVEESEKRSQATFEIVDDSGQVVAKVPFSG